jgi:hypothetical protein
MARTFGLVAATGLTEFTVAALFGDDAERETQVSLAELLALVRRNEVGTRTRYRVKFGEDSNHAA